MCSFLKDSFFSSFPAFLLLSCLISGGGKLHEEEFGRGPIIIHLGQLKQPVLPGLRAAELPVVHIYSLNKE